MDSLATQPVLEPKISSVWFILPSSIEDSNILEPK